MQANSLKAAHGAALSQQQHGKIMLLDELRRWAPVPIRLITGYGFFAHGLAKIDKGPEHFVAIVQALGVPFPGPMAWLTIMIEIACGLLMLGGALVPLIAIPMM